MPLPKGVFRIRKKGREYWYFQDRRGQKDRGPLMRLPPHGTPEFWRALAQISGESQEPHSHYEGSISHLIELYRQSPRWADLRKGSQKAYHHALKHISSAWGKLHASKISAEGVAALTDKLSETPDMANLTLSVTRILMKEAIRRGFRSDNPARDIERLKVEPDGAKPLTEAAWQALMNAPEPLKRLAILGRATGQRISDLIKMCPKDRDDDGIKLTIGKRRDKPHWCPLSPAEIAIIDGWKVFPNAPYLMTEGGKRYSPNRLRDQWNAWLETAEGAPCRGFTPHDLRATKVCDERIKGRSHQQIAAIVGMSVAMVMRYSKHIDQRLVARGTRTERDFAL